MIRFSYTMKVTYYASISEEELVLFAQEDGEEFSTIAEIYREEAEKWLLGRWFESQTWGDLLKESAPHFVAQFGRDGAGVVDLVPEKDWIKGTQSSFFGCDW